MNAATFAAAVRFHFRLPAGRWEPLRRARALPAAPAARQLQKNATTWIAHPLGRSVACEAGTLWLTFDNEPLDLILEAGQSHRCAKGSRLGIHALADSRLTVA